MLWSVEILVVSFALARCLTLLGDQVAIIASRPAFAVSTRLLLGVVAEHLQLQLRDALSSHQLLGRFHAPGLVQPLWTPRLQVLSRRYVRRAFFGASKEMDLIRRGLELAVLFIVDPCPQPGRVNILLGHIEVELGLILVLTSCVSLELVLLELLDAAQLLRFVHYRASVPRLVCKALLQSLAAWSSASHCSDEHRRLTLLGEITALPGVAPLRLRCLIYCLVCSVAVSLGVP